MTTTIKQVAQRLKALREIEEISQNEIAKKIGISLSEYVAYEEGRSDIPIGVVCESATVLGVDASTILTGNEPKLNIYSLVRNGDGLETERSANYKYKNLAYKLGNKKIEPFMVTVNLDNKDISLNSHPGQEMDYLVEGELLVRIEEKEFTLHPGDTLYFNSEYPHGMKALGDKPAKFLAIVMGN